MTSQQSLIHSTKGATLADVLERVLDKGVVIAGDIKIKLVDVELLTIQVRLVICTVDKAIEMGMNWWKTEPALSPGAQPPQPQVGGLPPAPDPGLPIPNMLVTAKELSQRVAELEAAMAKLGHDR